MQTTAQRKITNPSIVREYDIEGIKYTVTARVKAGVTENAAAKVRRLIKNEIGKKREKVSW